MGCFRLTLLSRESTWFVLSGDLSQASIQANTFQYCDALSHEHGRQNQYTADRNHIHTTQHWTPQLLVNSVALHLSLLPGVRGDTYKLWRPWAPEFPASCISVPASLKSPPSPTSDPRLQVHSRESVWGCPQQVLNSSTAGTWSLAWKPIHGRRVRMIVQYPPTPCSWLMQHAGKAFLPS